MKPGVPGEELGQASQTQDKAAEPDLRSGPRARPSERVLMLDAFTRTITLMETVSRTEEDVADTLRAMARAGGSEAAARRLRLAEEAIKGAPKAVVRGEQLQRMADRWARHSDLTALRQSLDHAGTVLADLASTEEDIAAELTRLASTDGTDLAEEWRHLADEAVTGAQRARDRARALRSLAETSVARARPRPTARLPAATQGSPCRDPEAPNRSRLSGDSGAYEWAKSGADDTASDGPQWVRRCPSIS